MAALRLFLRRFLWRSALGLIPLLIGSGLALLAIYLILYWETTITAVTVADLTLPDESGAQAAKSRLENGDTATAIAADYNLRERRQYNEARPLDKGDIRRLRLSDEQNALFFERQPAGTVLGPFETEAGWLVARIDAQTIIGLGAVIERIETRVLADEKGRDRVVDFWLPLLLCSLGLMLTFSAGLWNIGVEGQMGMGAVGATSIALFVDLPRTPLLLAAVGMGVAAGGAWALLAALLKTRGGVNEIFGGVALNFIAVNFTSFLLAAPWAPPGSRSTTTERFPDDAVLPTLGGHNISAPTVYLTIGAFVLVLVLLAGTRWGLQLRAMGKNERSARVLGVPTERNIWLAMTLCGMLAGLAGAHVVLFTRQSLALNVSGGIGFLGLLVVLLASVRLVWVAPIALAFAVLLSSQLPLQAGFQLHQSLIGVFIGLIVFFVLIFDGVRQRWLVYLEQRASL